MRMRSGMHSIRASGTKRMKQWTIMTTFRATAENRPSVGVPFFLSARHDKYCIIRSEIRIEFCNGQPNDHENVWFFFSLQLRIHLIRFVRFSLHVQVLRILCSQWFLCLSLARSFTLTIGAFFSRYLFISWAWHWGRREEQLHFKTKAKRMDSERIFRKHAPARQRQCDDSSRWTVSTKHSVDSCFRFASERSFPYASAEMSFVAFPWRRESWMSHNKNCTAFQWMAEHITAANVVVAVRHSPKAEQPQPIAIAVRNRWYLNRNGNYFVRKQQRNKFQRIQARTIKSDSDSFGWRENPSSVCPSRFVICLAPEHSTIIFIYFLQSNEQCRNAIVCKHEKRLTIPYCCVRCLGNWLKTYWR